MADRGMKFLLAAVNAKYIHSNPAIYSLRAYAGEELEPYIELAEYTINNRMEEILADLYLRKPDVLALSVYIWNWKMIQELLAELPKVLPDTGLWLGGPEVSYNAPQLLKRFPQLSGIMIGEGEETFRELLTAYLEGTTDFSNIAGLCLPEGYTPMREIMDMNRLPFLYRELDSFANRIIYYETSRGCPYRCSYCLSSIEKKVRLRNMDTVKQELQFFLDNRVSQVKFIDRTFNCNHDHAMAIWHYIKEHDNGITNFHFEISADILREDEISLLNSLRPGLVQLEIGVQSTNPRTIAAIDRVMDVEKLEKIVAAIHKGKNIHQHLDLIAGLPYEDLESFQHSFDRVYSMKPNQLQLGFLKVLHGSPMEERAEQLGIRYLENPPYEVLCSNWISYGEILQLKKIEEMVELYYNSDQFTYTLEFLEQAFDGPYAMYEALANFYEREGYFTNSPARSYRYQVLYAFAVEKEPDKAEMYAQLLTYDCYLRENVKSRPDFAKDPTEEQRDYVKNFYKQEEKERKFLPGYQEYDWKQMSKMTHLECFCYPVWDTEEMKKLRTTTDCKEADGKRRWVLFDYRNRNPLSYEAATQVVR